MQKQGLLEVTEQVPHVLVELKYATVDNFMKKDVYGCLTHAYLQKETLAMLRLGTLFRAFGEGRVLVDENAASLLRVGWLLVACGAALGALAWWTLRDGTPTKAVERTPRSLPAMAAVALTVLATVVSLNPVHVYFEGDEQTYLRYAESAREAGGPGARAARNLLSKVATLMPQAGITAQD